MIIPALDLINGNIVRLSQGNFKNQKNYSNNPFSIIDKYLQYGVKLFHIVDLNGASNPSIKQTNLLKNIVNYIKPAKAQIGGGIRTIKDIEILLNAGFIRVVLGTSAVENYSKVKEWIKIFSKNSIVLAADLNITKNGNKYLSINAWKKQSNISIETFINNYYEKNLKYILCTDIAKDGTMLGANLNLYQYLVNTWPKIKFQASGGVNTLNDLNRLFNIGVHSIIVGKALLENKFNISEALKCCQKE